MEEDEDVVEAGAKFVAENFELVDGAVPHHWQYVFFECPQSFACKPYYVVVELQGLGVACGIETAKAASANELFGKEDGEAKDLVEFGGEEGIGTVCFFGKAAKELLIDLRRGHQRVEGDITEFLELSHCISFGPGNSRELDAENAWGRFRVVDVNIATRAPPRLCFCATTILMMLAMTFGT